MNAYRPMVVPQTIVAFAPIDAPRRTTVFSYRWCRRICERGLVTLVNTHDGPQNTSSSRISPVYRETLFWILTLFPTTTSAAIETFCPILQFWPIRQFFSRWQKCQILVPAPISHGSSM